MDQFQPRNYILTNQLHGVRYIGTISKLAHRVPRQWLKLVDGFSKKYSTDRLVWYQLPSIKTIRCNLVPIIDSKPWR